MKKSTSEEELFSGVEESMLSLRVSDWVESSYAHDSSNGIAAAIIGIRIGAQHAAEICFKPKLIGCLALFASFVHAVAFDRTRNRHMDSHVQSGERIVATVLHRMSVVGADLYTRKMMVRTSKRLRQFSYSSSRRALCRSGC